jgi:succinate dehydrogenase / fumarate reductase membrane anchor subunit
VGVCSVWYDYAKPAGLRLVLQALSIIWLVSCGGWAVQVLWRL